MCLSVEDNVVDSQELAGFVALPSLGLQEEGESWHWHLGVQLPLSAQHLSQVRK